MSEGRTFGPAHQLPLAPPLPSTKDGFWCASSVSNSITQWKRCVCTLRYLPYLTCTTCTVTAYSPLLCTLLFAICDSCCFATPCFLALVPMSFSLALACITPKKIQLTYLHLVHATFLASSRQTKQSSKAGSSSNLAIHLSSPDRSASSQCSAYQIRALYLHARPASSPETLPSPSQSSIRTR